MHMHSGGLLYHKEAGDSSVYDISDVNMSYVTRVVAVGSVSWQISHAV